MPERARTRLAQEQDLEKGIPPKQHVTIDLPEPIYQRPSPKNPVLGSTPFQDPDLEGTDSFQFSTMNEAKKAPKKKRYIFGVPDNPLEDSELDNEWMRHIVSQSQKPSFLNESLSSAALLAVIILRDSPI
ncbi:hypothetical protein BDV38DRAFT_281267 [Aspergillus pseudotamarii]|uniref:Uncharacterized protein n=1 Tax=Aspergillus pseudotamarii TaxID=132259 RepID=A0A5N6SZD4_ASPPS|nr:uncharacterized protein BDV38DRAFT_281267 [Aspergillus pseudotamarii]KAE8139100.1 hypothetical protein BDV38DRAFT_281267 [Aspergillus pseudotamarii]